MTDPTIDAAEQHVQASRTRLHRLRLELCIEVICFLVLFSIPTTLLARQTTSLWQAYLLVAFLDATAVCVAAGYARYRMGRAEDTLLDRVEKLRFAVSRSVSSLRLEVSERAVEARHRDFEHRLYNALDMADDEDEVLTILETAFRDLVATNPVELLLAENTDARIARLAATMPAETSCSVETPGACPAVRRAQVQRFADSHALDGCPKLRSGPRRAAACVPVAIMGRTIGVIHATSEVHQPLDTDRIESLRSVANMVGARIGLIRVMAETQLQASTDSLTGLLNRRSLERNAPAAIQQGSAVVVVADLDHFKKLNDTFGHDTGDRALRLFAMVLRSTLRHDDLICRYGGEEFVAVLPNCTAVDALRAVELVRTELAAALETAALPAFTASYGLAEILPDEELAKVITRADIALFRAKRDGRDCIVTHEPDPMTNEDRAGTFGPTLLSPRRRLAVSALAAEPDGA